MEVGPGAAPRVPYQHQRGLGFRLGTLCRRSPYLGALKYHVVLVAVPAARTLPYACPRVVFPLPPLRRALPGSRLPPQHAAQCARPPLGLQPRAVGPPALAVPRFVMKTCSLQRACAAGRRSRCRQPPPHYTSYNPGARCVRPPGLPAHTPALLAAGWHLRLPLARGFLCEHEHTTHALTSQSRRSLSLGLSAT